MVPEFVCDEDDPPFQKQGGKNTEQVSDAETGKERLKVHVFEPGVQRAAQFNHLPGNRSSMRGARPLTRSAHLGLCDLQQGWPSASGKGKEKKGKQKGLGKERSQEIGEGGVFGRDSVSQLRVRTVWMEAGREDCRTRGPRPRMVGDPPCR